MNRRSFLKSLIAIAAVSVADRLPAQESMPIPPAKPLPPAEPITALAPVREAVEPLQAFDIDYQLDAMQYFVDAHCPRDSTYFLSKRMLNDIFMISPDMLSVARQQNTASEIRLKQQQALWLTKK